ncbi:MAG: peptidoglycan bridge formation glycyltransferase FemA/FemB family protein [bacterium]|nr:peptidoglycan bridge formation glycyltransferase FemA/FemB family protein [bacterium]
MKVSEAVAAEKNRWNAFVAESPYKSFMQTWSWGELQEYIHVSHYRLVVEDNRKIIAIALVIKRTLAMGYSWLYIPRGPIFLEGLSETEKESAWGALEYKLKSLGEEPTSTAGRSNSFFVRIDPLQESFTRKAWHKSPREVQPQHTLLLNVSASEEQLLAAMHPKTRYNIRVSEKRGVNVRFSNNAEDVRAFLDASQSVTGRTGFSYHPDEYYRGILEVLGKSDMAELAIAEVDGQVAAVHLMIYADGIATYAHGASKNEFRSSMAPALLYWKTIQRAKEKSMHQYDFFGVAPENAPEDHSWSGITRMKIGFGGTRVSYAGAYDLVFNEALYTMFNLARKTKQIIKNGLM